MEYSSGGTWLGVMKNSRVPVVAEVFVRFCTLNEENLTDWATGVYTQEYLADLHSEFDMPIGSHALFQPAGDFISSQKVAESIIPFFEESEMSNFLGGQNFYEAFAAVAPDWRADIVQGDNERIQELFAETLHAYVYEGKTKDDMLIAFKNAVQTEDPGITVD
jgi:hypothetical protein